MYLHLLFSIGNAQKDFSNLTFKIEKLLNSLYSIEDENEEDEILDETLLEFIKKD